MFYLNGKVINISFKNASVIVSSADQVLLVSIETKYLLNVITENDRSTLKIIYVVQKNNSTLKVKSLQITGDVNDIECLKNNMDYVLKDRPKRLLVFINPNSGTKKAVKLYNKIAVPLFVMCGVKAEVIVTSRQREPTDILKTYDLTTIDGLVAVGGDGLYCECMNGLVTRVQKDSNLNFNSHKTDIVPTSIPIGIIPAGSGDVIAQYLHKTRCARTAVLRILLGATIDSNIVSAHEGERLLSYSALILGFGLFGDMMNDCEKLRFLGPMRYNIVPVGSMLKRKEYDVEIEYHSSDKNEAPKRTRVFGKQISLPNGFLTPAKKTKIQRTMSTSGVVIKQNNRKQESEKEKARVYGVDTHAITMKEKSGRLTPRFGQDSLMVYTTRTCPLKDHISQLTRVQKERPDCYDYKFVSKHEVTSYRVKLLNATVTSLTNKNKLQKDYYLNCDGEVIKLTEPVFDVKLHRKAIKFYGDVTD